MLERVHFCAKKKEARGAFMDVVNDVKAEEQLKEIQKQCKRFIAQEVCNYQKLIIRFLKGQIFARTGKGKKAKKAKLAAGSLHIGYTKKLPDALYQLIEEYEAQYPWLMEEGVSNSVKEKRAEKYFAGAGDLFVNNLFPKKKARNRKESFAIYVVERSYSKSQSEKKYLELEIHYQVEV
jgi:hypothetical protein